uniref:Exonuclease domain-containing protein n=1 Tax=Neogobius melanostomus TaxID=47308 RepID=A0A8C6TTJ1_9GOBI
MVGTGPGGRVSEVARCSLVDYHGRVLFDKYILPIGRVTDFRSQWSGIRKHHLTQATPFSQARAQVSQLLRDKVLIGHAVQMDLKSLDLLHPGHMTRDTSTTRLLTRLAGFPREHRPSLKALTNRLLHRRIQVRLITCGRGGLLTLFTVQVERRVVTVVYCQVAEAV